MQGEGSKKSLDKVVNIDERRLQVYLGKVVRGNVDETLNGLLDVEADTLRSVRVAVWLPRRPCGFTAPTQFLPSTPPPAGWSGTGSLRAGAPASSPEPGQSVERTP